MTKVLWPTTRGWVFCAGGVIWLLIAMVNHALFAVILGWTGIALSAVSLLAAILSLHGLRVTRAATGNAIAGQLCNLALRIENHSWRRRQAIVLVEHLPFALERRARHVLPPVKGHSTTIFQREVLAVKRGEYRLKSVLLRSGDPAGLFLRERKIPLPETLVVYPPVEPLPDLLFQLQESAQSAAGNPISVAGISQDFYGIREYVPSDGMRFIHWKSSARQNKLMVKEFERNAVLSVAIFVDAYAPMVNDDGANLEYLIRMAASIASHCADLYCNVTFVAGGIRPVLPPPGLASRTVPEILYSLATLRAGNVQLNSLLGEAARNLPQDTVVFCLNLSHTDVELHAALDDLAGLGMDVRWYCAEKRAFSKKKVKHSPVPETISGRKFYLKPVQLRPELGLRQALCHW